jgi:ATP-dependent Clp protease protease subunit
MMNKEIYDTEIYVSRFTEESAKDFRRKLKYRSAKDPNVPIDIYIDSYGGYVDSLNSMLAAMNEVPNQIVTVCVGKAMSCGAVLLAAGDHRFCDPMARILVHEISGGAIGHNDDIQTDARESARLNKQMMEFLAMRCNKSYNDIKRIMKDEDARDLYLTAEQAKEFGLVDYIGLPQIIPITMYSIEPMEPKQYTDTEQGTQEALDILESFSGRKTKKKTTKKKVTKKKTTKKATKKRTKKR